jgi:hypothetical protein
VVSELLLRVLMLHRISRWAINEGTCSRAFHFHMQSCHVKLHLTVAAHSQEYKYFFSLPPPHILADISTPITTSFCTIILIMSPSLEQQQVTSPGECDTIGKGVFGNIVDETAAALHKDDEHDLASQTAALALDDHKSEPALSHNSTTGEEPAPKAVDENSNPKLAASTTAPVSVIPHTQGTIHLHQEAVEDPDRFSNEESAGCELEQDDESDNPTLQTPVTLPNGGSFTVDMSAVAKNTSEPKQADESDTPRLKTYMKLHNDVSSTINLPSSASSKSTH